MGKRVDASVYKYWLGLVIVIHDVEVQHGIELLLLHEELHTHMKGIQVESLGTREEN